MMIIQLYESYDGHIYTFLFLSIFCPISGYLLVLIMSAELPPPHLTDYFSCLPAVSTDPEKLYRVDRFEAWLPIITKEQGLEELIQRYNPAPGMPRSIWDLLIVAASG